MTRKWLEVQAAAGSTGVGFRQNYIATPREDFQAPPFSAHASLLLSMYVVCMVCGFSLLDGELSYGCPTTVSIGEGGAAGRAEGTRDWGENCDPNILPRYEG